MNTLTKVTPRIPESFSDSFVYIITCPAVQALSPQVKELLPQWTTIASGSASQDLQTCRLKKWQERPPKIYDIGHVACPGKNTSRDPVKVFRWRNHLAEEGDAITGVDSSMLRHPGIYCGRFDVKRTIIRIDSMTFQVTGAQQIPRLGESNPKSPP